MLPISYNRLLTAGIYLTESSSSKCSEPQAAISMRPDGETAFSLQVGQLTLDAYIWRLGRVWILHHYHLKHSPVRILCLILTAIWSESCPVFCRYIATTQSISAELRRSSADIFLSFISILSVGTLPPPNWGQSSPYSAPHNHMAVPGACPD